MKDPNTAINLYETGNLDRTVLMAEQVSKFKDRSDFNTRTENKMTYISFNNDNPIFSNLDIRKAFSMAIDTKSMVGALLNDGSLAAEYVVPVNFARDANGNDFRERFPVLSTYDLEKAQEHWELYKNENGIKDLKVNFLTYDFDISKKIGEYVKEQLEKNLEGLTIDIKNLPFKQKLDVERNSDYEFSLAGWGPDFPDPITFLNLFTTDNGNTNFSNTEYDNMITKVKSEFANDLEKRWEIMQDAEKLLFDHQVIGPIYQSGGAELINPEVNDLHRHAFVGMISFKWAYKK